MKLRSKFITLGFLTLVLITCNLPSAAAPGLVTQADPELPRDFSLPVPLFAPNSAWNQIASGEDVLPESDQQILVTYRVLRGDTTDLHPSEDPPTTDWPFIDINYTEYAVPIFRMGSGQQTVLLCDYDGEPGDTNPKLPAGPDDTVVVPAPSGMVRPSGPQDTGADGHLVLYNPETFMAYDYWAATTVRDAECESMGGGLVGTSILETGVVDFFDVREDGANPDTYFSARAHGTPLLAGLILPEDIENGAIAHALAFAIPGPRNLSNDPYEPLPTDYFYPASTTETDYYSTNEFALAAGQRIRLVDAIVDDEGDLIDERELAPITQIFLTALRTYGAYVVDNAAGFSFYAEDIHTAPLNLSDAQVNQLIGQAPGTPLPSGKTKWQLVIETLNAELEWVPFAYGPWSDGQDPAKAQITHANYEVIEPASRPSVEPESLVYIPFVKIP